MKPFLTSILIFLAAYTGITQTSNSSDDEIRDYLVGIWEHIRSIEPTGKEFVYERKLELNNNGTGKCTKYTNVDTVELSFKWEVKDSTIYLYYQDKKGVQRVGDRQQITWMGERMLQLHQKYNEEEYGKICAYRRKPNNITTEF